jgi:EAL domain-containing protein (putative c-di-GMP-specific phosphodiesterase class I)
VAQADRTGEIFSVQVLTVDSTANPTREVSPEAPRIRATARRIGKLVRTCDAWTYLGHGRFGILQRAVSDPQGALLLAQKLLDTVQPPSDQARVGFCLHTHGVGAQELLDRARAALERALPTGQRVSCLDAKAPGQPIELSQFEALQRALQQRQLFLEFQPQLDLESGRITTFEALVRWLHPTRGVLAPGEFIPLAESTDLIRELGRWVLMEACRWRQRWSAQIASDVTIAVNISASQLADPTFISSVDQALCIAGLPGHLLELELTERVAVGSLEDQNGGLAQLHQRGIQLTLDDFGTGFCSLQYLNLLNASKLKIPKEFTQHAMRTETSLAIVETVVALGKRLGMQVVAEGIESPGELHAIRQTGCPTAQGYLLGRPAQLPPLPNAWRGEAQEVRAKENPCRHRLLIQRTATHG